MHITFENAPSRNRRRLFPRDNEKWGLSCRTTGPCIVRRLLGMRKAATVTERIRPTCRKTDSQVSANDDVIFRSRYRLPQDLPQPCDFVTRVRNACTTNEKVVTSSHGLAAAPASCIAKSDLEKLSSVTLAQLIIVRGTSKKLFEFNIYVLDIFWNFIFMY